MNCLFCKILNKEIPANIIYEDEHVIAIDDIHPQAPVHKLIIPKQHITTINELQDEHNQLIGYMFQAAKHLAKELNIHEKGFRTVMNCNTQGGQTVFHLHLHLLGGRPMTWPPG